MKRSLLALAVLAAFTGVVRAQTTVNIFGSFDAGLRKQNHVGTTAARADSSKLTMGSIGTYNANRLGFNGTENLGGGMNIHFVLETGFNTGTGVSADTSRLFGRNANVGIGGAWGSVDLGRQLTVAFRTAGVYDPFNYRYTTIIPVAGASTTAGPRFDNDIQYTGVFGPLTFRAEHAVGEVAGSASSGSANAAGLTYVKGPLTLGAAYTWRKIGRTSVNIAGGNFGETSANVATLFIPVGTFEENKDWTAGGAYIFGDFRIAAGYSDEKQNNGPLADTRIRNEWFGGSYVINPKMGANAAWYRTKTTLPGTVVSPTGFDGKKDLFIVGLTYALSKRTNFYADVDTAKFGGSSAGSATLGGTVANPGTAPFGQHRQTAMSVGINHFF